MNRSGLITVFFAVIAAAVAFESGVAPASARQTTTTHKATTAAAPKATTAVAAAAPANPCCSITAINASTGIVTARVTATGQTFTFAAGGSALSSLRVGQGIYANLSAKQVSLDGKTSCCAILSTAVAAQAATSALTGSAPASTGPCCSVTAVNAQSNLATAESVTGTYFVFSLNRILGITPTVSVGQKVYANFSTKAVSLDGSQQSGTIKYLCTATPNVPCPGHAATCEPCPVGAANCETQTYTAGIGCPTVTIQTLITSCAPNYYGPTCSVYADAASTCSGHGTVSSSGACVCDPGYREPNCATQN